jgi:hypothetical protein
MKITYSIFRHLYLQRLIANTDEIVNTAVVGHDRSLMELRRTSLSSVLPLPMSRAVGDLQPESAASESAASENAASESAALENAASIH